MDIILEKIFRLMDDNKLNARSFEAKVGISNASVQSWKIGKAAPSRRTLGKITKAFGLPDNYFYTDNEQKPSHLMWTDDDYQDGVSLTKKVGITPIEEDLLDAVRPFLQKYGEKGKDYIIAMVEAFSEINK